MVGPASRQASTTTSGDRQHVPCVLWCDICREDDGEVVVAENTQYSWSGFWNSTPANAEDRNQSLQSVIDTFDGQAWIGLIPFEMRRVRLGPTPPVPYLGSFIEINVRTYVVDATGRRAVWFWSLDVPRSMIVGVARTAFALPYCWSPGARHSEHEPGRHRYTMRRRWQAA